MKIRSSVFITLIVSTLCSGAQTPSPTSQQIQDSITKLSGELAATQERLKQSQEDVLRLQQELLKLQTQLAGAQTTPAPTPPVQTSTSNTAETAEKVDILQAEVKQHEQTKVESTSKYAVKLTGQILFNTFVNKGAVDNSDIPSVASTPTAGTSDLSTGAAIRQSILGIQASGPTIAGAQTSGEVNVDFGGGIPYSSYGTVSGDLRLRTASLRMLWANDAVEAGYVAPLISPLAPESYAAVTEPALAWAGNLWTWAPQLSIEHRFTITDISHVGIQFGLWDPPNAGYNPNALFRTPSPGERSAQLAYESRISYSRNDPATGLQLGLSGYYSRQSYTNRAGDSWAVATDFRIPITHRFELSGEAYRGRAIAGLGGGVYKDIINGTDPVSGLTTFRLLNAAGGWTQTKFRFTPTLDVNAAYGLDDGFSRDFHSVIMPVTTNSLTLRARNSMATFNVIYTPKTYLILSPEFRRIWTWPIIGQGVTANIFTMTFGFRF